MIKKSLEEILLENKIIDEEKIQKALKFKEQNNCFIGEAFVKLGYATEEQIAIALSKHLGIPYASIQNQILKPEKGQNLDKIIPEKFARENIILPLFVENNVIAVAMEDPMNIMLIENIKVLTGMDVQVFISTKSQILKMIDVLYQQGENILDAAVEVKKGEKEEVEEDYLTPDGKLDLDRVIMSKSSGAQVIRIVNAMLKQALTERATDIHLEKYDERVSLRFRIDGVLHERTSPPKELFDNIIARVKILSKLNVAEKRLPQDGSFTLRYQGKTVEVRVAICPTVFGEKMVLRLLAQGGVELNLDKLGLEPEQKEDFLKAINSPHGLILITGPTGSGKTTTLATLLLTIKSPELNFMTLEDPVEIKIDGISQVQVKPDIGLTFAAGLRSFLRMDPDVILVGETRDGETASACVQAAMTGHLVLSTLHTNSALESIPRLIDMGVEPYLLASTLLLVEAQRLVRRLCPDCKQPYRPSQEELDMFAAQSFINPMPDLKKLIFYKPRGCPKCFNIGYKGRVAVYETYFITEEIKHIISKTPDILKIKEIAQKQGSWDLRASGWRKILAGVTSVEEVLANTTVEIK